MRRIADREDARRYQTQEATDMYQTKNDLPAPTRADVIEILNARLADSIGLMHQAKQVHWNVKGPSLASITASATGGYSTERWRPCTLLA